MFIILFWYNILLNSNKELLPIVAQVCKISTYSTKHELFCSVGGITQSSQGCVNIPEYIWRIKLNQVQIQIDIWFLFVSLQENQLNFSVLCDSAISHCLYLSACVKEKGEKVELSITKQLSCLKKSHISAQKRARDVSAAYLWTCFSSAVLLPEWSSKPTTLTCVIFSVPVKPCFSKWSARFRKVRLSR